MRYFTFFVLGIYIFVCILHFLHISIQTSHIAGVWWPLVACGYCLDSVPERECRHHLSYALVLLCIARKCCKWKILRCSRRLCFPGEALGFGTVILSTQCLKRKG